jgi:hypothetical protein
MQTTNIHRRRAAAVEREACAWYIFFFLVIFFQISAENGKRKIGKKNHLVSFDFSAQIEKSAPYKSGPRTRT